MVELQSDALTDLVGDKVRIKKGTYANQRGVLITVHDGVLDVEISSGEIVQEIRERITNYSLAARRAWKKTPKKSGRPRALKGQKRRVTLRIDEESWSLLSKAVHEKLIVSKEQAINEWIRSQLNLMFADSLSDKE